MKKNTTSFTVIFLAILIGFQSCRKMDHELPEPAASTTVSTEWKTVSSWSPSAEEGRTVYSASFQDSSLSVSSLRKGLVLVYLKGRSADVQSFPFTTEDGQEWYYQVSEQKLEVLVEASSGQSAPKPASIRYFILSEDKIKDLQTKGYTKAQLMALTYENAATLLK